MARLYPLWASASDSDGSVVTRGESFVRFVSNALFRLYHTCDKILVAALGGDHCGPVLTMLALRLHANMRGGGSASNDWGALCTRSNISESRRAKPQKFELAVRCVRGDAL